MEADSLVNSLKPECNHGKQPVYTQRRFDILNGFEYNLTRCLNCHQIVEFKAKKFCEQ